MNITKRHILTLLSLIITAAFLMGMFPLFSGIVSAQQQEIYRDPADFWLSANGRTNELDINATVSNETQYCHTCGIYTAVWAYRVPEYTKSGVTALNRNVKYSDGTYFDGVGTGNLDAGTPGKNAVYTGSHWTKIICQTCGTINPSDYGYYDFNNNVYCLNNCDYNFFLGFDNTTYSEYNDTYHTTTLKKGEYCQFCKGTFATAETSREHHHFHEHIDPQLGNQRFVVCKECEDCEYDVDEILAAKTVVTSYYGYADGYAHTIKLSDLSDDNVNTSIRYGTSAANCTLTSAPNYTTAGYYPVYYAATYSYGGESMVENGVSYVWLLEKDTGNSNGLVTSETHTHDYRYLDTVEPSCTTLGWENWQCAVCGSLTKTNYKAELGHNYGNVTIKEASCIASGMNLVLCNRCGDFHTEVTPMTAHIYETSAIPATCVSFGYIDHKCTTCGQNYITDITPYAPHQYHEYVTPPTCTEKGFTEHICGVCGISHTDTYVSETGHKWNGGETLTSSTCEGEGVKIFTCETCGETMLQALSAKGHRPGTDATCTEPQTCLDCGAILKLPTGHHYHTEIVPPTCYSYGYTVYTCEKGDDEYISDYTEKIPHTYRAEVVSPTCTEIGHTHYECEICGDHYDGDYTSALGHYYRATVTPPTCVEMGYTTYVCTRDGDTYTGDYTDPLGHDYHAEITPPDCESMGYTTFTCSRDGNSYIDDYTDPLGHDYTAEITPPTCVSGGYTTYTCSRDGHSEISDYTDKLPHNYIGVTTEPTCTELGYTVFTCVDCGDTYTGDYTAALGHTPSGWIIDEPATLDADGNKHIECLICGEILQTAAIKRLKAEDYTDNTGKANVGDYTIIVTDKNATPVPHSRVTIDVENKITVELPDGRLLDYSDQTTITVLFAETGEPIPGLNIIVVDKNGNAAIGTTDENGQITVPANSTNTGGNGNGTIGGGNDGEDDDNDGNGNSEGNGGNTYVVTVTDKNGKIIDNCAVFIDSGGKITVELPNDTPFDRDNPITVTIADNEGNPQAGLEVTITDGEKYETGVTDSGGKVTLPETDRGYTNDAGKIKVNGYIVIVENVDGAIAKAFITHTEENQITVLLPEPYILTVDNQTTVAILRSENETPVIDMLVTVFDYQNRNVTDLTDIHGKIIVPPLDRGYTDDNGIVRIYGYIVKVENADAPIKGAYVTHTSDDESGEPQINILLPGTHILTVENQTTVTILLAADETPVEGIDIEVSDYQGKLETDITDKDGKITVPTANAGYTDEDGRVKVNGYTVLIEDTKAPIENAFVNYTVDGESSKPQIAVELPDSHTLDENNQTTVTVLLKSDNSPVNGMSVTVTDKNAKIATKLTNSSGKITVPDKTPSKSGGGGGGSSYTSSSGGGYSAITNIVTVTDKDGNTVKNPTVMINSSGEIAVKLPSGYILGVGNLDGGNLNGDNWYTVTVKGSNGAAKSNVKVTLSDNDGNSAAGYTDSDGKVILPEKTHKSYIYGYPDYNFRPENGLTRAEAAAIFARLLSERKNEVMTPLPAFSDISTRDWHASAIGYLQSYGILNGYNDGTFKPDIQITRAEFVTMSVRFYNAYDKTLANTAANSITLTDISGCWAETSIKTALDYGWIQGYADGTFRGENNITRAEVVTLINRTTGRKPDIDYIAENFPLLIRFYDIPTSHWAFFDITEASNTHKCVETAETEMWSEIK